LNFVKELSVFNRITFIESKHVYLIDGNETRSLSVTGLIKKFKPPFDKEKMSSIVARKRGVSSAQIKLEWDLNNLYSTTIGSMLHKYIENFYNNKRIQFDGSLKSLGAFEKQKISETLPCLIKYFQQFYEDHPQLLCVKNELVLGDINGTKICGMADLLCYNTDSNQLEILDFKTNKKISETSKYGNLLSPFSDMSLGEINEYTIQLNVYKYFIEKYTNLKIDKLKIIWFNNVANENYKIFELKNIQNKIHELFSDLNQSSSK